MSKVGRMIMTIQFSSTAERDETFCVDDGNYVIRPFDYAVMACEVVALDEEDDPGQSAVAARLGETWINSH